MHIALSNYFNVTTIEYKCEVCDSVIKGTSSLQISRLPPIIVFTWLRFSNVQEKLENVVIYPEKINMEKYCAEACQNGEDFNYHLCSVVKHVGSNLTTGHYVSIGKYTDNRTYECSDLMVNNFHWVNK